VDLLTIHNILFLVGIVLLCVVALLSVKHAENMLVVLAIWVILYLLSVGLMFFVEAIFGAQ